MQYAKYSMHLKKCNMQHASMNINYMGQRWPVHTGNKTLLPQEKSYYEYDILQIKILFHKCLFKNFVTKQQWFKKKK